MCLFCCCYLLLCVFSFLFVCTESHFLSAVGFPHQRQHSKKKSVSIPTYTDTRQAEYATHRELANQW